MSFADRRDHPTEIGERAELPSQGRLLVSSGFCDPGRSYTERWVSCIGFSSLSGAGSGGEIELVCFGRR